MGSGASDCKTPADKNQHFTHNFPVPSITTVLKDDGAERGFDLDCTVSESDIFLVTISLFREGVEGREPGLTPF